MKPTTASTDGHTPRTDELSATVQNQNWGFRDMQILARKLESELTTLRRVNAALLRRVKFTVRPTRPTERFNDKDLFIAYFDGNAAGSMAETKEAAIQLMLENDAAIAQAKGEA